MHLNVGMTGAAIHIAIYGVNEVHKYVGDTCVIRLIIYIYERHTILILGVHPVEALGGFHKAFGSVVYFLDSESFTIDNIVGNKIVVLNSW